MEFHAGDDKTGKHTHVQFLSNWQHWCRVNLLPPPAGNKTMCCSASPFCNFICTVVFIAFSWRFLGQEHVNMVNCITSRWSRAHTVHTVYILGKNIVLLFLDKTRPLHLPNNDRRSTETFSDFLLPKALFWLDFFQSMEPENSYAIPRFRELWVASPCNIIFRCTVPLTFDVISTSFSQWHHAYKLMLICSSTEQVFYCGCFLKIGCEFAQLFDKQKASYKSMIVVTNQT